MSRHDAEISWESDGEFASGRYSRRHQLRFDGGAVVAGSSSPAVVPEPMSDPAGVDPEEALAASAAACHMLWFLSLAQNAGLEVASYRDRAEAEMGRIGPGGSAITRITLRPRDRLRRPPRPTRPRSAAPPSRRTNAASSPTR